MATVATAAGSIYQAAFTVGGNGLYGAPADSRLVGSLAEVVVWGSVLSGGTISDIMTDRAGYYGITLV